MGSVPCSTKSVPIKEELLKKLLVHPKVMEFQDKTCRNFHPLEKRFSTAGATSQYMHLIDALLEGAPAESDKVGIELATHEEAKNTGTNKEEDTLDI
jgi:hypothetical protein